MKTPTQNKIQILIVDDHPAVRDGLRCILSQNPRWQVCGEAKNGKEAVEKVQELTPDLIILDITMPVMGGIKAARKIRQIAPLTKIVLLSMHDGAHVEAEVRHAGGDAFVSKADDPSSLVNAVERLVEMRLVSPMS